MASNEINELRAIKNLLILLLIKQGATSTDVAKVIGVGESTIRTKFPMKKLKQRKR